MKKLLLFILPFTICFSAYAADAGDTLEERMSGREFMETGLVKLTKEELAFLNDWLKRHSVATLDDASARQAMPRADNSGTIPLTTNDKRGLGYLGVKSNHDPDDRVIYGTIAGTIDGWAEKGTLFKLTNGMVWEQTEKDSFSIQPVQNPEVTITKSMLGNWHISIVGYDADVRVKRIR
jgi:hypothetical protein